MNKAQRTFAIMTLVKDEYVTRQVPDGQFATYASSKLGISIARASITMARANLGIPSNVAPHTEGEVKRLKELLLEVANTFFVGTSMIQHMALAQRVRAALGTYAGAGEQPSDAP